MRLLILQHPREAKRAHGTAALVCQEYPHARIAKGLAWPNLRKAWKLSGSDGGVEPQGTWGVLFLSGRSEAAKLANQEPGLYVLSQSKALQPLGSSLEGIVLLDGNWKEAKTLWWRNAWLLRLKRLLLVEEPASDIRLRRSAQKAALSTGECAAYCLKYLGNADKAAELIAAFQRAAISTTPAPSPTPSPGLPPKNR